MEFYFKEYIPSFIITKQEELCPSSSPLTSIENIFEVDHRFQRNIKTGIYRKDSLTYRREYLFSQFMMEVTGVNFIIPNIEDIPEKQKILFSNDLSIRI